MNLVNELVLLWKYWHLYRVNQYRSSSNHQKIPGGGHLCSFIDNICLIALMETLSVRKDLYVGKWRSILHIGNFGKKSLIVLENMKYETKTKIQVPFVINWMRTIKWLQILYKRIFKDGFKFLLLRKINQKIQLKTFLVLSEVTIVIVYY